VFLVDLFLGDDSACPFSAGLGLEGEAELDRRRRLGEVRAATRARVAGSSDLEAGLEGGGGANWEDWDLRARFGEAGSGGGGAPAWEEGEEGWSLMREEGSTTEEEVEVEG